MKNVLITTLAVFALVSCKKDDVIDEPRGTAETMADLRVPSDFSFSTFENHTLQINIEDLEDNPMDGIRVDLYEGDSVHQDYFIASGLTNSAGTFVWNGRAATQFDEITVHARVVGIPSVVTVAKQPAMVVDMGGSEFSSVGKRSGKTNKVSGGRIHLSGNMYYLDSYDNNGVPNNLEAVSDVIDAGLLADVNASLPESAPVPQFNPHYLASGNETDVVITELADVWMTFVHEGAGYRNTMAFYVYPTNNPPQSASQIDTLFLVFPNLSFTNSGGGLLSGDKVLLGQFPAGTSIGFAIIPNGWNPNTRNVKTNVTPYYSNPDFNPESTASLRQHNVQLYDQSRNLMLTGFEDIDRSLSSCDNDFNDAIYYISSNPVTAIDASNVPPTTSVAADADVDGVPDVDDDYPNDATKAFDNYYIGNLGFEDLWPHKGDYDFNDLVMGYNIMQTTNAQNQVVAIHGDMAVKAIGAGNTLGFGMMLGDVNESQVQSVTGGQPGSTPLNANGTEAGQSKAVLVLIDDAYDFINRPQGLFFNTDPSRPAEDAVLFTFDVTFNTPVDASILGAPPYNSFIVPGGISTGTRREIHLPDFPGTDLHDTGDYGFAHDDSNPASGRYFRTESHLPWAINVDGQFDHPIEYAPIIEAYNNFAAWAESGGLLNEGWFLDIPGNRDDSKIW
ncbi:MAG: LruC domain-containing protein [Flavobacteriia bacterium]|nr:LruC domain-containing protein [Flavobacteriia bacterium]